MRRVLSVAALAGVAVLGLGSAFVLAGPRAGTPGSGEIAICHATSAEKNPFVENTPDASGILDGHAKHAGDIIPPFVVVEVGGATTRYPGQNMSTIYGAGYTGAEELINHCEIPTAGGVTGSTQTITTTLTHTLPVTVTTPGTTITVPGGTTTREITVTVTIPGQTQTAPGTTTVVTVPTTQTITVTLPERIVTLPERTVTLPERTVTAPAATVTSAADTVTTPARTVTVGGETLSREAVTVTLPAVTATVVGGTTTSVVTVTQPSRLLPEGAVAAAKAVKVTVTTPRRVVRLRAKVIRTIGKTKGGAKKVVVVVIRSNGCPPGTALFNGHCAPIVRGQG